MVVVGSANCSTQVYATQNKTSFQPQVDDFVLLQVANSHTTDLTSGAWIAASDVHFRVEIGNLTSSWKQRRSGDNVIPFWTAIIQASQGEITGIDWDDGCFACDNSQCINQTCGIGLETCYEVTTNGTVVSQPGATTNCDWKVYIGWYGSDKAGNIFTSNSKRLSAFRSYSVSKVYNTAVANAPAIPTKVPCVSAGGYTVPGCS